MSEALTAGDPPSAPPLRELRRLLPYVRPHRAALIGSGVAALTATLAGLAIPLVTRAIVDGPVARGELGTLPWLVLGVLAFGAVEAGLILLRRLLVAGPANQVEATMRADLYAHLQRLPVAFHDRWASGQLLSRATSDLTTIRWFVMFSGIFLVVNALTVVVGVGVLVWLSPWLGLVIAVMAGPLTVTTLALERRYSRAARRSQDQVGDLATVVEESVLGVRVLKSLGRGRRLTARFVADARGLRGTELTKVRLLAALWTVVVLVPEGAIAVILALGAYGVADGTLTLGTLVAAATVVTYLYWPVESLGWLLAEASNAAGATVRFCEVRDIPPAITDPPRPVALGAVRGELVLEGVRFRYPGAERETLRGVDLVVRPGETMALVGATGSGKTTLTALVPRLYDATGGRVLVDGVDVRDVALRRAAPGGRHRVRGPGADLRQRAGERGARPARARPTTRCGRRCGSRAPTGSSRRCRGGSTRGSASRGCRCRAGSGSGSRWPARCWAARPCWCSTTRSRRWTCTPRPRSRRRCAGCWAGSRRWSWRTGRPPCSSPTGWRCCATA